MTNNGKSKIPLKTLVLGLGNILMGDEGIGVYAVRALEQHKLPADVECLDGGTGGFTLLEPLQDADRIILIDAAADGNPVGTVTRTTPRFSRDYPPTLTAHDIGMKDLLDMFYIQGGQHEIVLYAITIDPKQPIRMSLSEQGVEAAQVAVHSILTELRANDPAADLMAAVAGEAYPVRASFAF
ncbi:MAG: hydrogenase maturation protease [Terracidiphilus sp.]|jgi:hydrogenase maturation protease